MNHTKSPSVTAGLTNLLDFENFKSNIGPYYQGTGDIAPGVPVEDKDTQVYNDLATSFTILLAIFFPSVTGLRHNNVFQTFPQFLQ